MAQDAKTGLTKAHYYFLSRLATEVSSCVHLDFYMKTMDSGHILHLSTDLQD